MSQQTDIERSNRAREVLENEVYADAWTKVEEGIHRQWAGSRNQQEREELHRLLLAHTKVRSVMEAVMRNGQMALKMMEQEQGRAEKMTGFLSQRS